MNALLALLAISLSFLVALAIELGQVILPQKVADSTDLLLETTGAMLGFFATRIYLCRHNMMKTDKAEYSHKAAFSH